jgi:hypothetical protein
MSPILLRPSVFDMHDPDESLVRLCDKVRVLCLERDALMVRAETVLPGAQFDRIWSRVMAKTSEAGRLTADIAKMPAHTMSGIRGRAAALQAIMPVDHGIDDSIPIDWHRGLLDALLRDLDGRVI